MDTLEAYRKIIQQVLIEYTKIPYAYGKIETKMIIDRNSDHYLIMNMGWENKKRIHGCLVQVDIINSKIWIQRDGTEHGIANELVNAGIPKDNIVLGFHPTEIVTVQGGGKKVSAMKSHVISTKTSLDLIFPR